jgi:hypothetical protein
MRKDSEFVEYNELLELKALGFNEKCFAYRESSRGKDRVMLDNGGDLTNSNFSVVFESAGRFRLAAPTYQKTFEWFRKVHKLSPNIDRDGGRWQAKVIDFSREDFELPTVIHIQSSDYEGEGYGAAEFACLGRMIKIVKSRKQQ